MSSNVSRRAATTNDNGTTFVKRQKLQEEAGTSATAMACSEKPGDRRPNFSAVNGGVKTSVTIAAKPGDIKKIIIKNFKSKCKWPRALRIVRGITVIYT